MNYVLIYQVGFTRGGSRWGMAAWLQPPLATLHMSSQCWSGQIPCFRAALETSHCCLASPFPAAEFSGVGGRSRWKMNSSSPNLPPPIPTRAPEPGESRDSGQICRNQLLSSEFTAHMELQWKPNTDQAVGSELITHAQHSKNMGVYPPWTAY